MRRLRPASLVLLGLLLAGAAELAAQSSVFGVRGLGLPGRPYTARTRGTAGAFGLFDGESDLNPGALPALTNVTAGFVLAPTRRNWESPAGDASLRETRFPLVYVGGPVPGSRVGLMVSFGSYADRDFKLASMDTLILRGEPVEVFDTLTSLGGLNEIRLASGLHLGDRTTVGAGIHIITGSNRMDARRRFSDTSYVGVRQTAEISYAGVGFSLGLLHQFSDRVRLALLLRSDGKADVDRDSTSVYSVDLPYTFGAGLELRPSARLSLAASGVFRTWSGANSDFQAQGGVGASNTLELTLGGELIRNLRRPANLPIRLGIRYAQLPFPVEPDERPHEFSIAAGTGTRFAQDRAGVDLALEHAWRSGSSGFSERALSLIVGLSIRPYGSR